MNNNLKPRGLWFYTSGLVYIEFTGGKEAEAGVCGATIKYC